MRSRSWRRRSRSGTRTSRSGSCRCSRSRQNRALFASLFGQQRVRRPGRFTHRAGRQRPEPSRRRPAWALLGLARAARAAARRERAPQRAPRAGAGGVSVRPPPPRAAARPRLLRRRRASPRLRARRPRAGRARSRTTTSASARSTRTSASGSSPAAAPGRPGAGAARARRAARLPARAAALLVQPRRLATRRAAVTCRRSASQAQNALAGLITGGRERAGALDRGEPARRADRDDARGGQRDADADAGPRRRLLPAGDRRGPGERRREAEPRARAAAAPPRASPGFNKDARGGFGFGKGRGAQGRRLRVLMGVSFLTPLDALFALAGLVPLAALVLARRRADAGAAGARGSRRRAGMRSRRSSSRSRSSPRCSVSPPHSRSSSTSSSSRSAPTRRSYFVFDTSLSMSARASLHCADAARPGEARRAAPPPRPRRPAGRARVDDRPDAAEPAAHDRPRPDRADARASRSGSTGRRRASGTRGRATTLQALLPIGDSHFYSTGVTHRILVVFTDGESSRLPPSYAIAARATPVVPPFLVHVWSRERARLRARPARPPLPARPAGGDELAAAVRLASRTAGSSSENQIGQVATAIHAAAGPATAHTTVQQYARVALAPWFVLAGCRPARASCSGAATSSSAARAPLLPAGEAVPRAPATGPVRYSRAGGVARRTPARRS